MHLTAIKILSLIGFLLSFYALYIEHKLKTTKHYKPLCDFNPLFSCAAIYRSKYGSFFGFPNSSFAMIYYFLIFTMATMNSSLLPLLIIAGTIATMYLAYLLFVKLKKICLICTSCYIINVIILILVII